LGLLPADQTISQLPDISWPPTDAQDALAAFNRRLQTLCLQCMACLGGQRNRENQRLGLLAQTYIKEHYADSQLSLMAVSNHANVSLSYFSQIFKEETGKTFVEYLTEVRMDKAKELLRSTDRMLYDIAEQVGYENPAYFTVAFKKQVGLSPRDYRKQFGKGADRMRRKSHLRDSIFLTSLFTIAGILAVFFPLSYFLTTNLTENNARDYSRQLLGQIKNSIEFYTEEMIMVSDYLAGHPDVIKYLKGENPLAPSPVSLYQQRARITSELKAISGTRQDLVNVILFREDGNFITNRDHVGLTPYWDYHEFDWYKETVAAKGVPRLSSSRVENVIAGEHRWVVSLSRAIYDQDRLLGVLLIDLNFKTISDICSNLSG
jgi:AraC-like DNA-binding protein